MAKYVSLNPVIDIEVCEVLSYIEDDDLQYEFWQRLDEQFLKNFLCTYCNENEIKVIREIADTIIEDAKDADEIN